MKTLSPETLERLTTICAGFAGSQSEISLKIEDLEELRDATSGTSLKSLDSLPTTGRSCKIPVPLLVKVLQEITPGTFGPVVDEPAPAKKPKGGKN